jgi:hypothetical protein
MAGKQDPFGAQWGKKEKFGYFRRLPMAMKEEADGGDRLIYFGIMWAICSFVAAGLAWAIIWYFIDF